jgi:archaellum biogenesis ATPase FlaH
MKDYENRLVKAILHSKEIFTENPELLNYAELFENKYNRFVFNNIKEYSQKFKGIPTEEILRDILAMETSNEQIKTILLDHFDSNILPIQIEEHEINYIKERIKTQIKERIIANTFNAVGASKLSTDEMKVQLERIVSLDEIQEKYEIINLWDFDEDVERKVIKTNLELIDEFGIAKGELGVLLAGTGVGKSVFLSFLASNFMLGGYNVLHIVFEGHKNQYLKSHNIKLKNPTTQQLKENPLYSNIKLVKMRSNITTAQEIEELIKDCIKGGFNPDALVIDYLDCIVIDNNNETWRNDIKIINYMEHLAQKYEIAIWSAIQANRSGISKPIELDNVSGSIAKVQKASMVLALTRTPMQEEQNLADVRVLKNRTGRKAQTTNCTWNPSTMEIAMPICQEVLL